MVVLFCLMSVKLLEVVKLKLNVKLLVIVLSCLVCCLMWTVNIYNLLTIGFGALWFMHLVLGCSLNIFLANFFNRSGHRLFKSGLGWPAKNRVRSWVNPFLLLVKKFKFESSIGSGLVSKFWHVLPCLLASLQNLWMQIFGYFLSETNHCPWIYIYIYIYRALALIAM